ncbi:MAG: hypothetical protein ACOX87_08645 [Chloroflexota bacterium]
MLNVGTRLYDPADPKSFRNAVPFAALLVTAVGAELAAAWLAYYTIGEIVSGMLFIALGLNVVPIALYALRRPVTAVLAALVLFAAIVPYQAVLGHRLLALNDEAGRVVAYLYETRFRTGEYPHDLTGYTFRDAGLQPYFQEYRRDAESGGFRLNWYVGTPSTSHSYTPRDGWGYYPD